MKHTLVLLLTLLAFPLSASSIEYHWQNAKGEEVSLDKFKGEPVILHFWASWCPPCRTEMPAMDAWMKSNPEVNVVVISVDSDQEDAQDFYQAKSIDALLNMGEMRKTMKLGVRGLPTTIIIDANGNIKKRYQGDLDWADDKVSQKVLGWLTR